MANLRQKKAAAIIIEAGGEISMGKALRQAGYSEATANNPGKVTNTKGWRELLNSIPEEEILNKLKENATQKRSLNASNTAIDIFFRLKGKFQKERENEEEILPLEELQKENDKLRQLYESRQKTSIIDRKD